MSASPIKISAIIITKNEEKNIYDCLKSIDWVDEIILVDSGSCDRTLEIAKQFHTKIYQTDDWPGFGKQKNRALSYATSEWILSIDADERVDEKLRQEILAFIHAQDHHFSHVSSCTETTNVPLKANQDTAKNNLYSQQLGFQDNANRNELARLQLDHSRAREVYNKLENSSAKSISSNNDRCYHGAYIPRRSFFCGQEIKYSGWSPDFVLRIFKKQLGYFSEDVIHERVVLTGKTTYFKNSLIHYSFRNLKQVVKKAKAYGEASAIRIINKKKKVNCLTPYYRAAWTWFRTYILKCGFLDKKAGYLIARMNARSVFIKYNIAYQHQQE